LRWIEEDQDNLLIGTAKAVARLMSFAQITCTKFCSAVGRGAKRTCLDIRWLWEFSCGFCRHCPGFFSNSRYYQVL